MKKFVTMCVVFFLVTVINITAQEVRNPVLEYVTGTWCGYCPCGHEIIQNDIMPDYPNAIILGYHGGGSDPFQYFYGSSIRGFLGFSSYPTGIVDRTSSPQSRGQWHARVINRAPVAPQVKIETLKSYDEGSGNLFTVVKVTALEDLDGDYYVSMVLTEDKLVATQTSYTGCPSAGAGYIHNHVVRSMLNGPKGESLYNGSWSTGVTKTYEFSTTIDSEFNANNCHFVVMVYKNNTNLAYAEIQQAEEYYLMGDDEFNVVVNEGWNLVSVPYDMTDMSVNTIFPNCVSDAYEFANGYYTVNEFERGKGYWLKFDAFEPLSLSGNEFTGSIQLNEGWNLIGVYDKSVNVSQITTEPANIVSSVYYGFNGSYDVSDNLSAGKGYWVKASQAGTLSFNTTAAKAESEAFYAKLPSLTIKDANGKIKTLYFSGDSKEIDLADMPPLPPAGLFDIRFASNKFVESINSVNNIDFQGVEFPVSLTSRGIDLALNNNGKEIPLTRDETVSIAKSSGSLSVASVVTPESFVLHQNYPNPFNPETKIRFELPFQSNIELAVFNTLGEKLMVIAKGTYESGEHEVSFNASELSSGIYLYKLASDGYVKTNKMVVLK